MALEKNNQDLLIINEHDKKKIQKCKFLTLSGKIIGR